MTIIEKIKRSVEAATGLPFLYHAAGEINELIARAESLPVAFAFLLDSGTIDDVNGRYRERVTLAVMFADKSQFDFNAIENEQIIDRMKVKAYKWLQSLRLSNDLNIVSINQTQRLYDATTDILTGFSVNVTIEDYAGYGECELPEVVFEIKANGEYDVVGIDKVLVNVLPQLEELTITQNGEYLPSEGVAGFSKVVADVVPMDKLEISSFRLTDYTGDWSDKGLIDWTKVTSLNFCFAYSPFINSINVSNWDVRNVINFSQSFQGLRNIRNLDLSHFVIHGEGLDFYYMFADGYYESIDVSTWSPKKSNYRQMFRNLRNLKQLDLTGFDGTDNEKANTQFEAIFAGDLLLESIVGGRSINDVIMNNITVFNNRTKAKDYFCFNSVPLLDRASLRAVINGLADLTGQTAQTLTLGATLLVKLTEEDIAIATNKNWTIV